MERHGQYSWLAVLENSVEFLSIFFVCDSDNCTLIKTSRV